MKLLNSNETLLKAYNYFEKKAEFYIDTEKVLVANGGKPAPDWNDVKIAHLVAFNLISALCKHRGLIKNYEEEEINAEQSNLNGANNPGP
ncbi:MAG: hypothetical protein IJX42_02855 [Oscillospiraceae bacterium]|nr:hypothetical protein [Oscillospiraceae bacterium]